MFMLGKTHWCLKIKSEHHNSVLQSVTQCITKHHTISTIALFTQQSCQLCPYLCLKYSCVTNLISAFTCLYF